MLSNQFGLPLHYELAVDLFSGGGGASTGIEQAIGRPVDIAINHDRDAIAQHTMNHPQTKHYQADIFEIDPLEATQGQPVGLLWASPACTHFSKARGSKPASKQLRSLAWVVVKWASKVRPRVIFLENVEEFQDWGPLTKDNMPCKVRKGQTFKLWVNHLKALGYTVDHKELRASDYGTPTIRKRLFLVARCDGQPIVWPAITHGDPKNKDFKANGLKPWRTAAECIDWSLPCPSIFDRSKPLAEATLRRIAKGIQRYVIDAQEPFIVQTGYGERVGQSPRTQDINNPLGTLVGTTKHAICVPTISSYYGHKTESGDPRGSNIKEPLRTQPTENRHALVTAFMAKHYGGVVGQKLEQPAGTVTTVDHHSVVAVHLTEHANASNQRNMPADEPLRTQCANVKGGHFAITAAHMTKFNTGSTGFELDSPMHTIVAGGKPKRQGTAITQGLVTSHLVKMRGDNVGSATDTPVHTITAGGLHAGEVRALLVKYYGNDKDGAELTDPMHTIPTKDRFGLVTVMVKGEPYIITDIGMRMLQPHELYAAQGFPTNYIIDRGADGKPLTKTAQVRMCGNSVCPPLARVIVEANYTEQAQRRIAA